MINWKLWFVGRRGIITGVVVVVLVYMVYLFARSLLASTDGAGRKRLGARARRAESGEERLRADLRRLKAFSEELRAQQEEMVFFQENFGMIQRGGYYTSDEHDKIESLLFRYMICRESLWDMIDYYRDYQEHFADDESRTKGFVIGFSAALHLAYYSSTLVAAFLDEPVAIGKLNEAFHRTGVPRGTYDEVFSAVTSVDHLEALKTAWELFSSEAADADSTLTRIVEAEADYGDLVRQFNQLHTGADAQIQTILEKRSLLLPDVRNRIRHSSIAALAKKALEIHEDNLYAARAVLFLNVSRLKSPIFDDVDFTSRQVKKIKSQLQPGDIILTFKSGFMSNIFLPGVFKHGITYVGSPKQRKAAGLTGGNLTGVVEEKKNKLLEDLAVSKLPSGHDADLIEAVAEGVIFSSLEFMLTTHMNRLVVLRPRISAEDRIEELKTVFLLLGSGYDFKFDFNDATFQCCTEVIYRALNARGDIQLPLTNRMGTQTLSADDIILYHLSTDPKVFDVVLLAEGKPGSKKREAVILTGDAGAKRLNALMKAAEEKK